MENAIKNYEDVDSWKTIMFLYNSALKEVGTKLEILNDEFQHVHKYNPIEHIKTRVKTPESIVKKLRKNGYEISIENMVKHVNDIAGVRLICVVDTKVEIQIRTIAMDFWASLEHKIYYKFEGNAPEYISRELRECAEMVSSLDEKMLSLNRAILDCLREQEELRVSTKRNNDRSHVNRMAMSGLS